MKVLTIRSAGASRATALAALEALKGKGLVNDETGIVATINAKQRNKILSNKAVDKSNANGFTGKQHNAVAANIEKAWKYATLVNSEPDKKGSRHIVSIKRFAAALELDGKDAIAHITAKESVQNGHKIYSLELQGIKSAWGKG